MSAYFAGVQLHLLPFALCALLVRLTDAEGASCTTTTMSCPTPVHDSATSRYYIEGSKDVADCGITYVDGAGWFNINIADCNVVRNFGTSTVTDTIVMVFESTVNNLIVGVASDPPLQATCTCSSPAVAFATNSLKPETLLQAANEVVTGTGTFTVTGAIYPDNTYGTAFADGQEVLATQSRLYFEMASASSTEDIIGLEGCIAGPTATPDADTVVFQGAPNYPNCDSGPLDFTVESEELGSSTTSGHKLRFSILNFKFGGRDEIFISCIVFRCLSQPCGACDQDSVGSSSARRLELALEQGGNRSSSSSQSWQRRLQEGGEGNGTGSMRERVAFDALKASGFDAVVLPSSYLALARVSSGWRAPAKNLTSTSNHFVVTNLTLFGGINVSYDVLNAVAIGVAMTMGHMLASEVQASQVFAFTGVSTQGPGVGAGSHLLAEAIMVECRIAWEHRTDLLQFRSLLDSPDFQKSFSAKLSARVPFWSVSLLASFGPLWLQENTHSVVAAGEQSNVGIEALMGSFIAVAAGSLLVGVALGASASRLLHVWRMRPSKAEIQTGAEADINTDPDADTDRVPDEGLDLEVAPDSARAPSHSEVFDVRLPARVMEVGTQTEGKTSTAAMAEGSPSAAAGPKPARRAPAAAVYCPPEDCETVDV